MDDMKTFVAFAGRRRIASGDLIAVAVAAQRAQGEGKETVLVFDDAGKVVDLDLRGSSEDVRVRLPAQGALGQDEPKRGPGRPKLGVVAREVTLLPRHWEWLAGQPGGASVALRRLVEAARRSGSGRERMRKAQDAAYRFAAAMAGDECGFEEAMRALFAGNRVRFEELSEAWPPDIGDHARRLAEGAFAPPGGEVVESS